MEALEFGVWMSLGALVASLHYYLPGRGRADAKVWVLALCGAIVGGWLGRALQGRALGIGDFSPWGMMLAPALAEALIWIDRGLRKPPRSTGA